MATFEDRQTCRKCGVLAREALLAQVHPGGFKTYSATCNNENCEWNGINWLFDVNPDGSIPEPKTHRKAYPKIPDRTEEVRESLDRLLSQSKKDPNARS